MKTWFSLNLPSIQIYFTLTIPLSHSILNGWSIENTKLQWFFPEHLKIYKKNNKFLFSHDLVREHRQNLKTTRRDVRSELLSKVILSCFPYLIMTYFSRLVLIYLFPDTLASLKITNYVSQPFFGFTLIYYDDDDNAFDMFIFRQTIPLH